MPAGFICVWLLQLSGSCMSLLLRHIADVLVRAPVLHWGLLSNLCAQCESRINFQMSDTELAVQPV